MMYLRLFFEFFKIGLFAVGGGMATIPFLLDLGNKTLWFTAADVADMLAVSESTPGPIGVNMATYVGFKCRGIVGSLCSTLGLIAPSIIVILIIAAFLEKFADKPVVQAVFRILRAVVVGLIAYALWLVAKISLFGSEQNIAVCLIMYAGILCCLAIFKKIHPIIFIGIGAVLGILFL